MNIANKLTVLRIIIVPIMFLIPYIVPTNTTIAGISTGLLIANILFAIGSITDFLDGYLARKLNLVTDFGKFLDPVADKMLVFAALLLLVDFAKIPAWILLIVVFREFAVSGYRLVRAGKGEVIAASNLGKLKTATQMIGIIIMFLVPGGFLGKNVDKMAYVINMLGSIMIIVSTILTVISGWDYLKNTKELLKDA